MCGISSLNSQVVKKLKTYNLKLPNDQFLCVDLFTCLSFLSKLHFVDNTVETEMCLLVSNVV